MRTPDSSPSTGAARKVTVPELRARKAQGPSIAMVTAYDFTTARLLDDAGVDALLVGDSLGMVFQGMPNTLGVTLDEVCYHGRAVARGVRRAHLVGDMPFMTFQVSPEQAVANAGRMLKEGSFEAVKVEGGEAIAEQVRRMVSVGIPVMGHVGLTPQHVHAFGGFRVQGRTEDAAERILADAVALDQAGVYAMVLEAMPAELAGVITRRVSALTIGIGAGRACDGQVLVSTDLLGLTVGPTPRFAKRFAELGEAVVRAARAYIDETRSGCFPDASHEYRSVAESAPRAPEPPDFGSNAASSRAAWT